MAEENLVINNRIISHQGIFRVDELFNTISSTVTKLGYQKQEKKTEETVFPSGKKTLVELRPFKIKTNYVTLMIKIRIHLDKVTETAQEVDGVKRNFQQGDVKIVMDAWSITDYGARWGMKPFFFFLKAVINKYLYHFPSTDDFVGELKSDTDQLTEQVRGLLSLYQYQVAKEKIK